MQGCRKGEKKKGEMEGNRQGGKKIGGGKEKQKKPLSFININPQERNSTTDEATFRPKDPIKPKDGIENRAVPGKISTERQKPWERWSSKDGDSREHKDMRGSARTELKTNADLRCRQIERHAASGSSTGKGSARPKAAGSTPGGPWTPRQAPLSVRGSPGGNAGAGCRALLQGHLAGPGIEPSLRHWQPGSSPPELPAKHNRETLLNRWARPAATPNAAAQSGFP